MTCSECDRPVKARGLCGLHYFRQWRGNHPALERGATGKGPWPLLTWFATGERILERDELARLLAENAKKVAA